MPRPRRRQLPEDMQREKARACSHVSASAAKVKNLTRMLDASIVELHDSMKDAQAVGVSLAVLSDLAGMSEGRAWQIVNDYYKKGVGDV